MLRNSASFSFQKKKIEDGFQSSFHYFSFFLRSPLGDETLTVQSLIPTCSSAISLLLQDTVASPMLAQGVGRSPLHTGTSPTPLSTTAWRQEGLSSAVLQYGRPRLAWVNLEISHRCAGNCHSNRSKQDGVADIPQMSFLLCENLLLREVPKAFPCSTAWVWIGMQVEGLRGNSTGGWGEYSFIHSVFTEHPCPGIHCQPHLSLCLLYT